MKKFGKVALVVALSLTAVVTAALAAYFAITADAKLDASKLINYGQTINIYDDEGQKIESSSVEGNRSSVKISDLSEETKNAFIASEDRKFYSHNGLNYGRMVKALFKNIASFSFKEGASTISQQLIKNTHLSNDKTLKRKLKEIRLTKQLERAYSKDEILEMYLNTIYFGHSCYGLQSAARFYFDTDAEDLSLEQSAALVGLLTSPNNYSPFKNAERCLERRNIVLKSMLECNFIDQKQYENAIEQPLGAVTRRSASGRTDYINAALDELDDILSNMGLDFYADISGCNVYTYMDADLQRHIEGTTFENDGAIIVTDDKNGVCAYVNTIRGAKRQPGSAIKPLLVYAPAFEEKILHPFTKIDDSKVDFGGYSPENYDKKYHGMVTASESIAKSYNIPTVKTLNALTISRAADYANKLKIALDEEDYNLSLALGGMKYGTDIKTLCDAYSTFRKGGTYSPSHFIKEITDKNGRTIYSADKHEKSVFSTGTCSLINSTLIETAKTGTAKKLKNLPYDVAAKTGTCGDEEGNTDAYAAAYTSRHSVCVWLGDRDNKKTSVTGGGECCNILKEVLDEIYKTSSPPALDTKNGTTEIEIDRQDYESDGKIILADDVSPKLNKLKVRCLSGNEPRQKSTKFSHPIITKPTISVDNNSVSIVLCKTYYYSYLVKCDDKIIYDGKYKQKISDCPEYGKHVYSVTPYYCDDKNTYFGDTIYLDRINFCDNNTSPLPPAITNKDWFS